MHHERFTAVPIFSSRRIGSIIYRLSRLSMRLLFVTIQTEFLERFSAAVLRPNVSHLTHDVSKCSIVEVSAHELYLHKRA